MQSPTLSASLPRLAAFVLALTSLAACASKHHAIAPPAAEPVSVAALEGPGSAGADGIGDPMFPLLGNGGYDVERYDLALAFTAVEAPIDATVKIDAKATQRLSRFNLDFHGFEIRSVHVDLEPAAFGRVEDELVVTPARSIAEGESFVVEIAYSGVPEGVPDPSMPVERIGWLTAGDEVYVFSEPSGAMSFYPCNNHPRDKALYRISVTVPEPLVAVSNGRLAELRDEGAIRTYVYEPRDPIATYLVTLAIAEFDIVEMEGPGGLPIRNYFAPGSKASSRKAFERTPEVVAFLSDAFGEYPFEVCGGILSGMKLGAALETQTIPVYGAGAAAEYVIAHELAHQWFGDSVSPQNWGDIWLNEGFASYAEWMYGEHTKGKEAFEKSLVGRYGYLRAAAPSAPGSPTATDLFGANVYVRGPFALHALRLEVGDEAFLAILRTWCEKHRNGNASVAQFVEHASDVARRDVSTVLNPWLYDAEPPRIAHLDVALEALNAEKEAKRKAREEEKALKEAEREAKKKAKEAAEKPPSGGD